MYVSLTTSGGTKVAYGEVDGLDRHTFVRSLLTHEGMTAECEDGWKLWTWVLDREQIRTYADR